MNNRVLLAIIALLVGPALSLGRWYMTVGPIKTMAWVEQNATPRDSVLIRNAVYHAAHASAIRASKWSLSGYATDGVAGALIGAGLLLSARRRRAT